MDSNVKLNFLEFWKENTGENLCDLWLGKALLHTIQKAHIEYKKKDL